LPIGEFKNLDGDTKDGSTALGINRSGYFFYSILCSYFSFLDEENNKGLMHKG